MDVHKVGSFYKGGAVFKFKVICPHTIFMDNAKVVFVCFSENMFKKIELFNSTKLHLIHLCNFKKKSCESYTPSFVGVCSKLSTFTEPQHDFFSLD